MLIRCCSECLLCLLALSLFVRSSTSSSHYRHQEEKEEEEEERSSSSSSEESALLSNILMCLRREYTLKATRSDTLGRTCWDIIRATSCWGRCDSFEIPDWRFPYKISFHPVCIHDQKVLRRVHLRNCDPGVEPELRIYEFYEAQTCSCKVCNSSDTFCDWRSHVPAGHLNHNHHQQQQSRVENIDD